MIQRSVSYLSSQNLEVIRWVTSLLSPSKNMQLCNEQIRTHPLFSPPCASATYGSARMCRRKNGKLYKSTIANKFILFLIMSQGRTLYVGSSHLVPLEMVNDPPRYGPAWETRRRRRVRQCDPWEDSWTLSRNTKTGLVGLYSVYGWRVWTQE